MAKEKPTTKICKYCRTEIFYDAKVCPICRRNQGIGCLPKILIFLAIIILIEAFWGNDGEQPTNTEKESTSTQSEQIEYKKISVKELNEQLDKNPAKASRNYKDKYLEITGKLEVIDSDMDYISVHAGDYEIFGVKCYIITEEQEEAILELEIGQEVTVKGKCTDVSEITGYYMDIDSIK